MPSEPKSGRSHRIVRLTEKLRNKRYRDSYVDANVRRFLAQQFRALRGDMSQEEFGKLIGKPQSVVSRLEDPSYGKFALQTLLEVAASLNRAVVARIVDFPTFLQFTEDLSPTAICPAGYDEEYLDRFALGMTAETRAAEETRPKGSVLEAPPRPFNDELSNNTLLDQLRGSPLGKPNSALMKPPSPSGADLEQEADDILSAPEVAAAHLRRDREQGKIRSAR